MRWNSSTNITVTYMTPTFPPYSNLENIVIHCVCIDLVFKITFPHVSN